MSIHFISGKPGGGKTLYSVRLIIDELVNGTRPIVTNVPLKLAELNTFLQDKHPQAYARRFSEPGRHITQDVTVLDEDDLPKFFTYRANNVRLASVTNAEWKQGKRPDFSLVKDSGLFYVLDEVHIAFNSRAWADTGAEVLYYLSQHRKLGDDVVCITQSIGNVDKQFRSVAQDFTYIKNLSKQRVGLFRLPAIFTRNTYAQPATDMMKPMETGTFKLDVSGMASLYDTARGVGIHGRAGADTNSRKKGFHWLVPLIGVPLILILLFKFLPSTLANFLTPNKPAVKKELKVELPKPTPVPVPKVEEMAVKKGTSAVPAFDAKPVPVVYCHGWTVDGYGGFILFMSDGNQYTSQDKEIDFIHKKQVGVLGKTYQVKAKQPTPLQPSKPTAFGETVVTMPPSPIAPRNDIQVIRFGARNAANLATETPGSSSYPASSFTSDNQ